MSGFSEKAKELFEAQFREWKLARDNYEQLDNVRVRTVSFPGFDISVQFNPGRITSSAAKVDARSVESRPCFLCSENRPSEQRGVPFGSSCTILINPFPIFRRHLTIVNHSHTPQRIAGNFGTMLTLAQNLPEYILFYNGPECGASAPDHLHFQAGNRGFLRIEEDMLNTRLCKRVAEDNNTEIWLWNGYGRGIMTLKGSDNQAISAAFDRFRERLACTQPDRPEPMLNILAWYDAGCWTVHIIPRRAHRPACYFAEDESRILLSPASVDIGGVFITPREEDFRKITARDIMTILGEVCLGEEELTKLTSGII